MFHKPRQLLSYANIAATFALVFSMSGAAWAAKHYLITSKAQISPKVLAALRGGRGSEGSQGPQGATGPAGFGTQGPQGAAGNRGIAGETGSTGPSGPEGADGEPGMPAVGQTTQVLDYEISPAAEHTELHEFKETELPAKIELSFRCGQGSRPGTTASALLLSVPSGSRAETGVVTQNAVEESEIPSGAIRDLAFSSNTAQVIAELPDIHEGTETHSSDGEVSGSIDAVNGTEREAAYVDAYIATNPYSMVPVCTLSGTVFVTALPAA